MSDITRFTDTPEGYFHNALELIDNAAPRSEEEQTKLVYQAGELIARGILPQIVAFEDEDDGMVTRLGLHRFEGYQTRVNPSAYQGEGLSIESTIYLFTKHVRDDGYPLDPETLSLELDAYKGVIKGPKIAEPLVIENQYRVLGGWAVPGSMVSGRHTEDPHFRAALRCELKGGKPQSSWDFRDKDETDNPDVVPDLSVVRQFAYHLSKSSVVPPTVA